MIWGLLALISAALLGIYDIFKKKSLNDNAVLPVLFFSTLTGALVCVPFLLLSRTYTDWASQYFWFVPEIGLKEHLFFFIKSLIVGSSWIFAYFAVKNLPMTIVSPIRSSGPFWTLIGAILIFGEVMNALQWIGVITTIVFYYIFSFVGKKEGIEFRSNKWVLFMILATIISSFSALYDKFLVAYYHRVAIQVWFSIYMVPFMGTVLMITWWPKREQFTPFKWRYTIPLIGATLIVADFIYFMALSSDGALVAVISTIRRSSVVVSFSLGALLFKEKNIAIKALILSGILAGIVLIILGGAK